MALFGGTFDPVHKGHLTAAREILKQGLVGEVWFIPVYWHAFKRNGGITAIEHRKKMIELTIGKARALRLVDLMKNPTYTVDTILEVKKRFPANEYFWLMGTDLVEEFSSWKEPERVLRETRLILYPVPGSEGERTALVDSGNPIRVEAEEVDLSSTVVRQKLQKHESVSGLLPEAVEQYIKENKLYLE